MNRISWWRRLRDRLSSTQASREDAEEARAILQTRYHSLRLLLAANTRALQSMATMEQAAAGGGAFGMSYVRSHCTEIGVNVFKMVRSLDVLAPGKYSVLFERLEDIERRVQDGEPRRGRQCGWPSSAGRLRHHDRSLRPADHRQRPAT